MEKKHTCGLCGRRFTSGRALGGHMRSHVISAKAQLLKHAPPPSPSPSAYSSSFSAAEGKGKRPFYGLREKPRKSFRLADPDVPVDGSSSVVQDGESETESSMAPVLLPRSRPTPELVRSTISDATTEEDVARCLMMLSRDIWTKSAPAEQVDEEEEDDDDQIAGRSRRRRNPEGRSRFQCGTCKKTFRSYQALGGHRAGHNKLRGCGTAVQNRIHGEENSIADPVHECSVCFRVFGSGQALGGHKRSHLSSASAEATSPLLSTSRPAAKFGESSIDLNLPAPVEEEVELSAVSTQSSHRSEM